MYVVTAKSIALTDTDEQRGLHSVYSGAHATDTRDNGMGSRQRLERGFQLYASDAQMIKPLSTVHSRAVFLGESCGDRQRRAECGRADQFLRTEKTSGGPRVTPTFAWPCYWALSLAYGILCILVRSRISCTRKIDGALSS